MNTCTTRAHTEDNICSADSSGPTAREGEDITETSLSQCAVKYNHRELEVELCTLLSDTCSGEEVGAVCSGQE